MISDRISSSKTKFITTLKSFFSGNKNNKKNEKKLDTTIYIYTKRLFDFFLAAFGLIFFSPLFLLIAIIIKALAIPFYFLQQFKR